MSGTSGYRRKSTEERLAAMSRRAKVAAMLLEGATSQKDMAIRLGMDGSQNDIMMITRDIAVIKKQWKDSQIRDFDEIKGKELARLDWIEEELWRAWHKSKNEKVAVTEEMIKFKGKRPKRNTHEQDTIVMTPAKRTTKKETRDPNPQFATLILKVIEMRCKITGILAEGEGNSTTPPILGFRVYAPEGMLPALAAPDAEVVSDNKEEPPATVADAI